MKIPPFLIGAVTVYWGICSGWIALSIVAAIVFESVNFVGTRFDLKDNDFIKISDLSSLVMLILLFFSYLENEPRKIFLYFISTMPIVFMPLMFAQLFSTRDTVVIGTSVGKGIHRHEPLDIRGLYLISVFVASASADNRALWFFPVTLTLILFALSGNLSTPYSVFKYVIFSISAFIVSFVFIIGIETAHLALREKIMELYRNWSQSLKDDPYKTSTAMGETGYMKLSGKIVMRVDPVTRTGIPLYLKTADYNLLSGSTWHGRTEKSEPVFPDGDMSWPLFGEEKGDKIVSVSKWMGRMGQGLLALPSGTIRVENMDVAGVEKSGLGSIQIDEGPDLLDYTVYYQDNFRYEPLPEQRDVLIPDSEIGIISKIVETHSLKGANNLDSLMRIEQFFSDFSYSLELQASSRYISILEDFLTNTKRGHCEYFASATVLLLRRVGIPARYSVGYAVSEYSKLEQKLIARERDAHAWVTAFIDGKWTIVDTTPSVWYQADREKRSFFEPVNDFLSWIRIEYEMFRRTKNEEFNRLLIIVASLLTLFMMIKIYVRKKKVSKNSGGKQILLKIQGVDSPFYTVLGKLRKRGLEKFDNESIRRWKNRVSKELDDNENKDLSLITELHERLRFDPGVEQKPLVERLIELCGKWLARLSGKGGRKKQ